MTDLKQIKWIALILIILGGSAGYCASTLNNKYNNSSASNLSKYENVQIDRIINSTPELPGLYWHGSRNKKQVALTFDDGPHPKHTIRILEILRKHKVKATFFMLAENVRKYPNIAKRVYTEGHEIGNHSRSHMRSQYDRRIAEREFLDAQKIINNATGHTPRIVRPPYGMYNTHFLRKAMNGECNVIYWSNMPEDWMNIGSEEISDRVLNNLKNGDIILLHDGAIYSMQSANALPNVITQAKNRGYKFVTVSDIIGFKQEH